MGTIITGYSWVSDYPMGGRGKMLGAYSDDFISEYLRLTDMVHSHDCNLLQQLVHIGAATAREDVDIMGPSAMPGPYNNLMPREMGTADIVHVTQAFADAAVRFKKSGFDGVEIHAAHKFLISQFLSPAYKAQQIEQEKLDKILGAGNVAPTAVNYQPQRIYVLQSEEALAKAKALCPCTYDAPTVLMIAYDDSKDWDNPKQAGIHSGEQDVSIVATHMMLEAWNLGIASCWVNLFLNDELAQAFDLPESEKIVLLMPLGYAADDAKPIEKWHNGFKAISETVEYR